MQGVGMFAPAGWSEPYPFYPSSLDEADPASFDPTARLARMDEYGIAAQVLYPNLLGFDAQAFLELGLDAALTCVQTYNDFLTEFASHDPNRLVPLTSVPFWDVAQAVAEVERCHALGHKGIILAANYEKIGSPNIRDASWHPLLDAAQSLDLSINLHIGFSQLTLQEISSMWSERSRRGSQRHPPDLADFVRTSAPSFLGNAQAISDIILGGLCERYPRLKFVSVESGFGYIPFLVEAMDWQWHHSGAGRDHPNRLLPSEYFRRQIYATFWYERPAAELLADYQDNVMFETDFPHPTSLSPGPHSPARPAHETISRNLAGIDEAVLVKVLHTNAAQLYHLT